MVGSQGRAKPGPWLITLADLPSTGKAKFEKKIQENGVMASGAATYLGY